MTVFSAKNARAKADEVKAYVDANAPKWAAEREAKARKEHADAIAFCVNKILEGIKRVAEKGETSFEVYDANFGDNMKLALKVLSKKPYNFRVKDLGEREVGYSSYDMGHYTRTHHYWDISW